MRAPMCDLEIRLLFHHQMQPDPKAGQTSQCGVAWGAVGGRLDEAIPLFSDAPENLEVEAAVSERSVKHPRVSPADPPALPFFPL